MSRIVTTSRALNTRVELLQTLTEAGHEVDVVDRLDLDEAAMRSLAIDADALIVGTEPVTAAVIAASPELKIIARPGVGYDRIDVAAAKAAGVYVTVTPGANTDSVADHTMALLLAVARNLAEAESQVRIGQWPRSVGIELRGRTLGLLGYGAIGRAVAERARSFGMMVVAEDPYADVGMAHEAQVEIVDRAALLDRSDVISIHASSTTATRGLVDAPFFEGMRPGAIIINTARGDLLDEAALAKAVESGQIGGAGLDVLTEEPPRDSPVCGKKGIIVTPHIAAYTEQSFHRMATAATASVLAAMEGRKPNGLIAEQQHQPILNGENQ